MQWRMSVIIRWLMVVVVSCPGFAFADDGPQILKMARDAFEYGDFARTARTLGGQATRDRFPLEADRIEAYRLLGLSYFYMFKKKPSDQSLKASAQEAFFDLLKQNPDFELDPFYTPPEAVSFFDQVRRDNETYLDPIRTRRQSRLREQKLEDDARREAERRRREEQLTIPQAPQLIIERELERPSFLVAMMPFGVGQFQNNDTRTGIAFLSGEIVSAALSIISWSLIELMRDPESGRYSSELYGYANTLQSIKYWSAGTFYGLWLVGAVHAGVRFEPVRVVREGTVDLPSAAPLGPLTPRMLEQQEALFPALRARPQSETPPTPQLLDAPAIEPGADDAPQGADDL